MNRFLKWPLMQFVNVQSEHLAEHEVFVCALLECWIIFQVLMEVRMTLGDV